MYTNNCHYAFQITAKMKKSLQGLGYQENDIKSMTPLQANTLIESKKKKSLEEKLSSSPPEGDTPESQRKS